MMDQVDAMDRVDNPPLVVEMTMKSPREVWSCVNRGDGQLRAIIRDGMQIVIMIGEEEIRHALKMMASQGLHPEKDDVAKHLNDLLGRSGQLTKEKFVS